MTSYIPHNLTLDKHHVQQLAHAIKTGLETTLNLAQKHMSGGSHILPLLKSHIMGISKNLSMGKGIKLRFSKRHLNHIHRGGFLQFLLPILEAALPTIGTALLSGAVSSLASTATNKITDAVQGKGLSNFGQISGSGCECGNGMTRRNSKKKTSKMNGMGLYTFGQIPRQ